LQEFQIPVLYNRCQIGSEVGSGTDHETWTEVGEINVKPTHLSLKGIQYEDPISKKRLYQIEE
jgi:hypothetical protein